jgi:hypothetical protein
MKKDIRVRRNGGGLVMAVPAEFVHAYGIKHGDIGCLEENGENGFILRFYKMNKIPILKPQPQEAVLDTT